MVPVSLIKNSKYLFIHKNVLMAGICGAPLQGNFSDALRNSLNNVLSICLWQYVVMVYLLCNLGTFILVECVTAEATVQDELMWS